MNRIGLQLYTLREETAEDMEAVLRDAAGLGYEAVEFAGYGNLTPADIRRVLDELNLAAAASHIPLDQLENNLYEVIREQKVIGSPAIVCPFLPEERRKNAEDYVKLAQFLNETGARCAAEGLRFVYHHHDFEFKSFEGRTGMSILREETDADAVSFEADVYWLAKVGEDPASWLLDHKPRLSLIHLKDMGEDGSFAALGDGVLDLEAIVKASLDCPLDCWIVEQDETVGPAIESVKKSMAFLKERRWR